MSEQLGVCDDVSRGKMPHVQDIGCVNWRGMMTAPQAPQAAMDVEKYLTHQKAQAIARQCGLDPTEESFAKAVGAILCAAAQLAEKEREMQKTIDLLDSQLGESMKETKAAEERTAEVIEERRSPPKEAK